MKINSIPAGLQYKYDNRYNSNPQVAHALNNANVSFQGDKGKRAANIALAAIIASYSVVPPIITAMNKKDSDAEISLTDVSMSNTSISELYFRGTGSVIELTPNEDVPVNNKGAVIVNVTNRASEKINEGATLSEIINKVYSDALDEYDDDEKSSVYNKIIDETVQSNPALSEFINKKLGDKAESYDDIASLKLSSGVSKLTMPSSVVYQAQGNEISFNRLKTSMNTYSPKSETASVIKGTKSHLKGEYSSLSDLIYDQYGKNLSKEAYRDILYAIVNAPENASEFENLLENMSASQIRNMESIDDLNRTLEENTSGTMFGLTLPTVSVSTTKPNYRVRSNDSTNSIIYQISPSAVVSGQNDKVVTLKDKSKGKMQAGDVYTLKDALQYYSSPDGNGRIANVVDGELKLNSDVNYVNTFASNIMYQIAYANLEIFSAQYEDEAGIHEYGVFDVNDGYDVTGKTLEEIIANSTISMDRLSNYSFVNEKGQSKFEEGVQLNLPQFNYRINDCTKVKTRRSHNNSTDPTNPTSPTSPAPTSPTEPTTPTTPTTPTSPTEPTTPTSPTGPTEPTAPTEPTSPTEPTTPTTPTEDPTTPTCDEEDPDIPTEEETPTVPVEDPTENTEPTKSTSAEIVDPIEPEVPTEDDTPTYNVDEPTTSVDPTEADEPTTTPTSPTEPTEPTSPTEPTTSTGTVTPTEDCDVEDDDNYEEEENPSADLTPESSGEPTASTSPTEPTEPTETTSPTEADEPTTTPSTETNPTTQDEPTTSTSPSEPDEDCDEEDEDEYVEEDSPVVLAKSALSSITGGITSLFSKKTTSNTNTGLSYKA